MTSRWLAVGVAVLLLVGPIAVMPGSASGSEPAGETQTALTATATDNITITQQVSLTPDTPGEVRITMAVSIPDRVESFAVRMPARATVRETDGFSRDGSRYEWTGADGPTLTYAYLANETVSGEGPEPGTGTYLFADTGPWALVRPPQMTTSWGWRGDAVGLDWHLEVAGDGAAGETIAFLGRQRTQTRQAHGQTFRLSVPERASMAADPNEVLDGLATASDELRVGDRDGTVFTVVAPAGIDWAVRGLQTGDSDMWVSADEELNVADNAWFHEYVHTRQRLNTTASTKWLIEGSASYYAAVLALDSDRIGFGAFAHHLRQGTDERYDDVILAENSTWTRLAEYEKGALVAGEIDRRIRLATNRTRSFDAVFAALNRREGRFDHGTVLDLVAETGNESVRAVADRYVRTDASPAMWTRSDHEAAFSTAPAQFSYELAVDSDTYRIDGPFRNVSVDSIPGLAVGERLTVPVAVTNDGGRAGTYEAVLTVDGDRVARTTGTLAAGAETTVELGYTADKAGAYRVSIGESAIDVTVSEPATPTVTAIEANRTEIAESGAVSLTAIVQNDASIPAKGTVAFTRDDTVIGNRTVHLEPAGSRTIETTVRLSEPGTYVFGADGKTTTVTVSAGTERTPTDSDGVTDSATGDAQPSDGTAGTQKAGSPEGATTASGPGFTALVALVAVLIALGRRW